MNKPPSNAGADTRTETRVAKPTEAEKRRMCDKIMSGDMGNESRTLARSYIDRLDKPVVGKP